MSHFWYLSFADDERGGFLGGCIVQGNDMKEAHLNSIRLKINPGGEVAGWDVTGMSIPYPINTLLTREEMERIDGAYGKQLGEMTPEETENVAGKAELIDKGCNENTA